LEGEVMDYVPYYCEENIWRLLSQMSGQETWAILAFGRGPSFAMFHQKAGRSGDGLALWDYHVFALTKVVSGAKILDFDTELGFTSEASFYLEESFASIEGDEDYAPIFRVVDGSEYGRRFYSDRSHMRRTDGSWLAPPPPWPIPGAFLAEQERWPLADLRNPSLTEPPSLLDLASLRAFVGRLS
jgi:hypothetical protein